MEYHQTQETQEKAPTPTPPTAPEPEQEKSPLLLVKLEKTSTYDSTLSGTLSTESFGEVEDTQPFQDAGAVYIPPKTKVDEEDKEKEAPNDDDDAAFTTPPRFQPAPQERWTDDAPAPGLSRCPTCGAVRIPPTPRKNPSSNKKRKRLATPLPYWMISQDPRKSADAQADGE